MEKRSEGVGIVRALALPALTITIGLQLLRVFFPSLAWYLRDTIGIGSISLAVYAFGSISVGLLAALVRRVTGPRLVLWLTIGGMGVVRLVEQFVTSPDIDLLLSLVGSALFSLSLPVLFGHLSSIQGASRWSYGVLLGVALDSALRGLTGTLDLSWISQTNIVVVILVGLLFVLLLQEPNPGQDAPSDRELRFALPLLAFGPFLLLQELIFQSQGWISEVGKIAPSLAFVVLMIGNFLLTLSAKWAFANRRTFQPLIAVLATAVLGLVVTFADRSGLVFLLVLVIGQLGMGWAWALLSNQTGPATRGGLARTTVGLGLGTLLFLILTFIYYAGLDLGIPIPRESIPIISAVIFGLCLIFISAVKKPEEVIASPDRAPILATATLIILALAAWVYFDLLTPIKVDRPAPSSSVSVMTYNIHSSFNTAGYQDPEAIAQVIESSGAEIIGLQEVSRGWLIDGSTDLVAWLARRLDMEVLFKGTTDPMWGNAILTRYPVVESGFGSLPLDGTLLARGYLWVELEMGTPEPLLVIDTHLHHIEEEPEPRLAQIPVLLDFWNGRAFSIIIGDLNSQPDWPEMALFEKAGLIDSWVEAGSGDGFTFYAADLYQRIDFIWHTPDLIAKEAKVIQSLASDHLGVVVTLDLAP